MPQYYVYKLDTDKFRDGIRGGYKVRDIVLTATGFSGVENTDWKCIKKILLPVIIDGTPSSLVLTSINDMECRLDWTRGSTNEEGFIIYRSDDFVNYSIIGRTNSNEVTYNDDTINPENLYYYKVCAFKGKLVSGFTNVVNSPLSSPVNLLITILDDVRIKLDWTLITTNEDDVRVYKSTDNINFTLETTLTSGTETYTVTGLTQVTTYYFYIIVKKDFAYSNPSNKQYGMTNPTGLYDGNTFAFYTTINASSIVKWSDYRVERWEDSIGNGNHLISLNWDHDINPGYYALDSGSRLYFPAGYGTMCTGEKVLTQPVTYYFYVKLMTWGEGKVLLGPGKSGIIFSGVRQTTPSPNVLFTAGTWGMPIDISIGVWHLLKIVFNGANSSVQVDDGTLVTGNIGTNSPLGLTVSGAPSGLSGFLECEVRDIIVRKKDVIEAEIVSYLTSINTPTQKISMMGDSTVSNYLIWRASSSYLHKRYFIEDFSLPAQYIADQKALWVAADDSTIDCVIINVGLGNIVNSNLGWNYTNIMAALQDLVVTCRTTLGATKKIIIGTLTPSRGHASMSAAEYTMWLQVNESILGGGVNPIIGVDGTCDPAGSALNNGSGYLATLYDGGDGQHLNDIGRHLVADCWQSALNLVGF